MTYSARMTRAPDPNELARRFLDLWQDQVQAMATDPEMADAVRRWSALWTGPGRSAGTPAPAGPGDGLQLGYRPAGDARYDGSAADGSAGDGQASEGRREHGRPGE